MRSAPKRRCAARRGSLAAHYTAVSLAVLVFSGLCAKAATISNRDDKEQVLAIIEGEKTANQILQPKQVLEKVCLKGCVIRLNGSEEDEYELEAEDLVSIEDGYLYYDAPPAPSGAEVAPPQPGGSPPFQTPKKL